MRSIVLFFVMIATLYITISNAARQDESHKFSVSDVNMSKRGINQSHGNRNRRQKRNLLDGVPLGGLAGSGGRNGVQNNKSQDSSRSGGFIGKTVGGGLGL